MRRICSAVLVSLVLMALIFGASPTLALTEENSEKGVVISREEGSDNQTATREEVSKDRTTTKEEVDVSREEGSDNQTATKEEVGEDRTTTRDITVNTGLMEEYDRLVKMLGEAESKGDKELTKTLLEKIRVIKEEISEAAKGTSKPQLITKEAIRIAPREVTTISATNIDKCDELKAWESKRARYEAFYTLTEEELKSKGYSDGKEEIRKIISELDEGIRRLRIECEASVTTRTSSGDAASTPTPEQTAVAIAVRPTAAESAGEITIYYKSRIAEIAVGEVEIEQQIANLKELRDEIDRLIEGLIKSKDKINTEEVSELVTRIEVRPGELKMDQAVVRTIDKSVLTTINNKDLEIEPTERHVTMRDGNLEVRAAQLSIENGVLRTGNSEVKVMPSTIIEKLQIEPKEFELKEEHAKAVYKIKTVESRKLLGFIRVKIEKTLTVDAVDTEVKTIDEKGPWWAFLTTK